MQAIQKHFPFSLLPLRNTLTRTQFVDKITFLSFHHSSRLRFTLLGTPVEFFLFLLLVHALVIGSHFFFFLFNALIFVHSFISLGSKYPKLE